MKCNNNNNNNLTFILRLKHAMHTQMRRSLHIGKRHDPHLEACCRGISRKADVGKSRGKCRKGSVLSTRRRLPNEST